MDLYPVVVAILNLRAYSLLSFAKRQLFPDLQILVSTSWALHIRVHSIFVPQFTGSKISKTFATDQNLAKLQSKQKNHSSQFRNKLFKNWRNKKMMVSKSNQ